MTWSQLKFKLTNLKFKNMKKLFFLLAVAALSLTSCTEEIFNEDSKTDSNQIGFRTMVSKNHYAKVTELTNTTFEKFWVSAYRTPASANLINGQTLIPYINNLPVWKQSGIWGYTGAYYWPVNGDYLHFFAHNAEGSLLPVTSFVGYPSFSYTQDPTNSKDIIVAIDSNKVMSTSNADSVALEFHHALCQLNFSLKSEISGPEFRIKNIKVNAQSKGLFTFKDQLSFNWTGQSTFLDYTYFNASPGTEINSATYTDFKTATNPIMIIPQNGEFVKITVTYDFINQGVMLLEDATASVTLTSENMNVGKKVRYNLTIPVPSSITGNKIEFTGTVTDWNTEVTGGVTVTTNP